MLISRVFYHFYGTKNIFRIKMLYILKVHMTDFDLLVMNKWKETDLLCVTVQMVFRINAHAVCECAANEMRGGN